MEARGVLQICERSVQKNKVRNRPMIMDGDSNSYQAIVKAGPYGMGFPVEKGECVNHYSKRLGRALRELTRTWKGINTFVNKRRFYKSMRSCIACFLYQSSYITDLIIFEKNFLIPFLIALNPPSQFLVNYMVCLI